MKKLISALGVALLLFCSHRVLFSKTVHCYAPFDFGELSALTGDWQYYDETIYFEPNNDKFTFFVKLFIKNLMTPIVDPFGRDYNNGILKHKYRARIFENGTIQSYNFFCIGNDDSEYEFDSSDYFSYIPLQKFRASRKYDVSVCADIEKCAIYYDYNMPQAFKSQLGASIEMQLVRKNSKDSNANIAVFHAFEFNSPIYISAKKADLHAPNASDAIVFFDELDKVKLEDVTVLSIADCNLKEIPEIVGKCKKLTKLFASFNDIKFNDRDIEILASLPKLKVLDIRCNDISASDDPNLTEFKRLNALKKIYIGGRNLSKDGTIPKVFSQMPGLELLSISFVRLDASSFPEEYNYSSFPSCINISHSFVAEKLNEKLFGKSYFLKVMYPTDDSRKTFSQENFNLSEKIWYGRRYEKKFPFQRSME